MMMYKNLLKRNRDKYLMFIEGYYKKLKKDPSVENVFYS